MKKNLLVLSALLSFGALTGLSSCGEKTYEIAMITDYGDITDQSFNQTTWEAVKDYATKNNKTYAYYKPSGDSTAARVAKIEQAIKSGAKVVVMPGFAFAGAIHDVQDEYKDVKFIALDVSEFDIHDAFYKHDDKGSQAGLLDENNKPHVGENVVSVVFQEEEAGYLAGYAAVMDGETKLGFLGGMAVPAVQRYGYGYVQGIADAANKKDVNIDLWYVYGGTFSPAAEVKASMEKWVSEGCQTIFACGGGIYASAVDAMKGKDGCKLIGVDSDQSKVVKDAPVLTSAMKGLTDATVTCLDEFYSEWKNGGKVLTYGLKSDSTKEYVGLPRDTWSMKNFTLTDYDAVIKEIRDGKIIVNNDTTKAVADLVVGTKITIKNDNAGGSIK